MDLKSLGSAPSSYAATSGGGIRKVFKLDFWLWHSWVHPVVGEQLAAIIGLSVGASIGASIVVVARRRSLPFPPLPALLAVLSAAMAVAGLVEGDSTASFMGAMLALFFMYPLIWRSSSTALKISYSLLLIAVSTIFIAVTGIGVILRLTGILALVGLVGGIASIVMLAKH